MNENIAAALDRAAALFGDRLSVVDGELRWTYRELHQRVAGFDTALDSLGLNAGDVVAVLSANSAAHLVAWLAIPRGGRVFNDLNIRLAVTELEFIVNDSGARALLVDDMFLDTGLALAAACPSIEHVIHAGTDIPPQNCLSYTDMTRTPARAAVSVEPDAAAGIFYTGGTTGVPKGVILTHRNLVANAKHALIELGYDDTTRYLHAAPMFHAADGLSTYALTWVGGCHVVIPAFDARQWLNVVQQERVTNCTLVPTMVNMILNDPALTDYDVSSLRRISYGGSPMPTELLVRSVRTLTCEWMQLYGMTEASPLVSAMGAEDHRRGVAGESPYEQRLRSAGRPIVGVEVQIRRPDDSRTDVGETGEIWVRGPNIMEGYWNRPEETTAALPGPDCWYRSGDAGYIDTDGYLYVVDRIKDMIITGGENVYCTEVENALYRHPAVLECAVIGVPDPRWGERVHAAIVLKPGTGATVDNLIDHCRPLIAGYKVPRSIDFHDRLPRSGAGKYLKRELREPYTR